MWHEARRQEKKIRCMLVDYQRRAQRRKDYYEKIKADPTQFLQLHGRPCKIYLDPAIVVAANSPATMMPWQGNNNVTIDRFDVRAHLDVIPEVPVVDNNAKIAPYEERHINYERYRILVQNDFFGIAEEKYLHQIYLEEKFGPVLKNTEQETSKKKSACVAIGYDYETSKSEVLNAVEQTNLFPEEIPDDNESEDEVDLDLTLDIDKIEVAQANELNTHAHAYGMVSNDFFSFLSSDLEEAEALKLARAQEEEKAMYSGRKSRKERRAYRERTLVGRTLSPPSYAWRESPSYDDYKSLVNSKSSRSRTRSTSKSPPNAGKITYITSFGTEDPATTLPKISDTEPNVKATKKIVNLKNRIRNKRSSSPEDFVEKKYNTLPDERSISPGKFFDIKSKSRSRSRSYSDVQPTYPSASPCRSRSKSRTSRSLSKRKSCTRSRSRSKLKRIPNNISQCNMEVNLNCSKSKSPVREIRKENVLTNEFSDATTRVAASGTTAVPRYYGRCRVGSSSSLSVSSDSDSAHKSVSSSFTRNQNMGVGNSNAQTKSGLLSSGSKLNPQERLRRKRQVLLKKQFKADKRAEEEKMKKVVQERLERAEEIKEISIKLRRRQRMLRHEDSPRRYSSCSDTSGSYYGSYHHRSYSRSNSPHHRSDTKRSSEERTSHLHRDFSRSRSNSDSRDKRLKKYDKSRDRDAKKSSFSKDYRNEKSPEKKFHKPSEERSLTRQIDDKYPNKMHSEPDYRRYREHSGHKYKSSDYRHKEPDYKNRDHDYKYSRSHRDEIGRDYRRHSPAGDTHYKSPERRVIYNKDLPSTSSRYSSNDQELDRVVTYRDDSYPTSNKHLRYY